MPGRVGTYVRTHGHAMWTHKWQNASDHLRDAAAVVIVVVVVVAVVVFQGRRTPAARPSPIVGGKGGGREEVAGGGKGAGIGGKRGGEERRAVPRRGRAAPEPGNAMQYSLVFAKRLAPGADVGARSGHSS